MKNVLVLTLFMLFFFTTDAQSLRDYDYLMTRIAENFVENIIDKDECKDLMYEAQHLKDEIETLLEERKGLSNNEISALKKLQSEANALEDFISSVGDIYSSNISIPDLYLANYRVKARIDKYKTEKPNISLMKITIGEYVCCLLTNETYSNYKVTYKWNVSGKVNRGSGEMGLPQKTARNIFNNRDDLTINSINVFGIESKVF